MTKNEMIDMLIAEVDDRIAEVISGMNSEFLFLCNLPAMHCEECNKLFTGNIHDCIMMNITPYNKICGVKAKPSPFETISLLFLIQEEFNKLRGDSLNEKEND